MKGANASEVGEILLDRDSGVWFGEDMGISFKFEPHEEFLHCKASGQFGFEDACLLIRDVLSESAQRGATKVLVDCLEMGGSPTVVERYGLAEYLAHELIDHISARKRFPRLAFLGKEPLVDPNRLGEIVATNSGVQMKTVERMEDALKWLGDSG